MPTLRNYSNTASQATLVNSQSSTDTSILLTGFTGYPAAPFTAALSRGTANEEVVLVTGVSGSTVTVTRGYDGTTAKAQGAGATFQEVVSAVDFSDANAHINTVGGAHGTTSPIVGTNDVQTLTNKTLTSPTISNPTVTGTSTVATENVTTLNVSGTATTGQLAVSGNSTVSGTETVTGALNANGGLVVPTGKTANLAAGQVTAAPSGASDIVRKDYADGLGVSTPTASSIARRDAAGRMQAADPSASADVATKNYVDTHVTSSGDTGWVAVTLPGPNFGVSGSLFNGYRAVNGMCTVIIGATSGDPTTLGSIFTIPTSVSPYKDVYALAEANGVATAEIKIDSTGNVQAFKRPNTQAPMLATITFPLGP